MKTKIVKRGYVNAEGRSLLYLHVSHKGKRTRISLDLYVPAKAWETKKSRLKLTDKRSRDINLILDNIDSKITGIRTMYRLAEKQLSAEKFVEEFKNSIPRMDFLAFMEYQLELEKNLLATGTYRRHQSVLTKMRGWKDQIFFSEVDQSFPTKARAYLKRKGNASVTIESNMASLKKFIRAAEKTGIRMALESSEIKIGNTNGNRVDLRGEEIKNMYDYYTSKFILAREKLVAGYFLFACFTGLRISDVQQLNRKQLGEDSFHFMSVKTRKKQWISISKKLRGILEEDSRLFVKKVSDVEMNRVLKDIARHCGLSKNLTFHVARHSFATNFLRMGGKVQDLQKILGHSKITETMIYVHIVDSEACEKNKIMDNLF